MIPVLPLAAFSLVVTDMGGAASYSRWSGLGITSLLLEWAPSHMERLVCPPSFWHLTPQNQRIKALMSNLDGVRKAPQ